LWPVIETLMSALRCPYLTDNRLQPQFSMVRATIVDDLPLPIDQLRTIVGEGIAGLAFPKAGS